MKYPIKLKREIINGLLHIAFGGVISFGMIPYFGIAVIIPVTIAAGIIREYIQYKFKKIQPFYIQVIDVIGLVAGGLLWYWIKNIFNININLL